jgi:MFS family permease
MTMASDAGKSADGSASSEDEAATSSPAEAASVDDKPAPPPAAPPAFVPKPPLVALAYIVASVTAGIMQGLGTSLISVNVAQIAGPLEATTNEASWLMAAYLFPNASLALILFKVRMQYGIRNFCEIAIIPYVLVSLAHLWVNDLGMSIVLRFCAGAAAAPISSMALLYMIEIFPPEKKLTVGISLALIGLFMSTPVAGLVSPMLLDLHDLQGLYIFELGLALVTLCFIYLLPLASPPRAQVIAPMDYVSYAFLAVCLGCLSIVFTMGRLYWWFEVDWLGWLLVIAIASGTVMLVIEINRNNKLIDVEWLFSREVLHFTGVLLVFRMLLTEQSTGVINFFKQLGLFNDQMAGLYWVILAATVVSGLVCAMVVKPGREAEIHLVALLLIAGGTYMDSQATVLTRPEQMYLSQAMLAFGSGLFLPPAMAVGFGAALKKGLPYLMSFIAVFLFTQKVGAFIGSAIFGTFVTWREQYHSSILTSRLLPTDPLVEGRLQQYIAAYARTGADSLHNTIQGTNTLVKAVQQQAYVLAYNDAFFATFIAAVGAIVLLLLHVAWDNRHRFVPTRKTPEAAQA